MGELIEFLLVEDNEHDVAAMRRAWEKSGVPHRLHVAPGGETCLEFLADRQEAIRQGESPMPVVVLLDDRMATMGGVETLARIRENPDLCHVPVVMLMASAESYRELKTYRMGANAYIVKPTGADRLTEVTGVIVRFWELAELPEPALHREDRKRQATGSRS